MPSSEIQFTFVTLLEPAARVEVDDQPDRDPERHRREQQRHEPGAAAAALGSAGTSAASTPPASGRKISTLSTVALHRLTTRK